MALAGLTDISEISRTVDFDCADHITVIRGGYRALMP
jgi:hypothetical protein